MRSQTTRPQLAVNLKSRQFYGFMGINDYNEALIEELTHDSEERDYYYSTGSDRLIRGESSIPRFRTGGDQVCAQNRFATM
jgi:hypothetical protein